MVVGWEKQLAKWCEQLKGSKYSRKFVMGSKAGKGRRDWSWQAIPMNENRNTRRKLDTDTGPDDENARSAVLSRFSCEPCHAGMSAWLNKVLDPSDFPQRVHCKRGTKSARIVLNTRAQCQISLQDSRMMASLIRSPVLFVSPRVRCLFVNLDYKNGKSNGKFSVNHSKKISSRRTPKALTLFQPLISERKRIWKTSFQVCSSWRRRHVLQFS